MRIEATVYKRSIGFSKVYDFPLDEDELMEDVENQNQEFSVDYDFNIDDFLVSFEHDFLSEYDGCSIDEANRIAEHLTNYDENLILACINADLVGKDEHEHFEFFDYELVKGIQEELENEYEEVYDTDFGYLVKVG